MAGTVWTRATRWIDREWSMRLADGFAVAFAVALPWSTSIATIFSVLWLIAVVPAIDPAQLRRIVMTPAGGLPVLFFLLFVLGMFWAVDVSIAERLETVRSAFKFLFIPLLIAHFLRSKHASWVMIGFFVSCTVLLALSWLTLLVPDITMQLVSPRGGPGVPARDYIAQSNEFMICIFLLAAIALETWRKGRHGVVAALTMLCAVFLLDLFAITTSRTALVVLPVLVLVFAIWHFSHKGVVVIAVAALAFAFLVGALSPNLRDSVIGLVTEVREYKPEAERTRAGERIEFWSKSIGFVSNAPLIGHGTGSIRDQFRRVAVSEDKFAMQALVTSNPHGQIFATAIQLGLVGTAVMIAMWLSHLLLFWRGAGFAAWAGLVIVAQNIVGSLFNSHLFDFLQGWGYVLGVGVAAGALMKRNGAVSVAPRSGSAP